MELKAEGHKEQKIISILENFYEPNKIQEGLFDLRVENVCKNIVQIPCLANGKCADCELKEACLYKETAKLFENISKYFRSV